MPRIVTTTFAVLLLLGAAPREPEPGTPPTFSDPTSITNAFVPFVPESVNVYHGRREGDRTVDVYKQLAGTRAFTLNGRRVETRIIEHHEFADGALEEITTNYIAQDDAGNVRYFGEVSVLYANGQPVGVEEDSWLVGGPGPQDASPAIQTADAPAVYMPADPQLGDVIPLENHDGVTEQLTVVGVGLKVATPAGNFSQAILVEETHPGGESGEGGQPEEPERPEYRWLVPGVGMVKERSGDHRSVLIATSMQEVELEGGPQQP